LIAAEEAVEAAVNVLEEASQEESQSQMQVGEIKSLYDDAKAKLDDAEKRVSQFSSELRALSDEKANLVKKVESMELDARKISVAIARIHKEQGNAERLVATMLKKHSWIESEKSAFGVRGGDYDFEETDPSATSKQLHALKNEQESLVRVTESDVVHLFADHFSLIYHHQCCTGKEDQQEGDGHDRESRG
jgi:structural maintenance of chromosome 2